MRIMRAGFRAWRESEASGGDEGCWPRIGLRQKYFSIVLDERIVLRHDANLWKLIATGQIKCQSVSELGQPQKGVEKEAWVVDYIDQAGKRRLETFTKKKAADDNAATANVEVRTGVHTADSASVTIAEAGKLGLETGDAARFGARDERGNIGSTCDSTSIRSSAP